MNSAKDGLRKSALVVKATRPLHLYFQIMAIRFLQQQGEHKVGIHQSN